MASVSIPTTAAMNTAKRFLSLIVPSTHIDGIVNDLDGHTHSLALYADRIFLASNVIQYTPMDTSHIDTSETSPAVRLGQYIRNARHSKGLTIAQLAEQIDRPREWLNRIELGHSEFGEHRPPSMADL